MHAVGEILRGSPAHRLRSENAPQLSSKGAIFVRDVAFSRDPRLLRSSGGQELVLDDFQSVGEVAAFERDRLVVGAVDEHPLVGIQTDADAGRGVAAVVGAIPHHDVEAAIAAVRLVESDEALVADRGEDGLVGTDRPRTLDGPSPRTGRLYPPRMTRPPTAAQIDNLLRANMMDLLVVD